MILEDKYKYINPYEKENVFLRKDYYELVCAIITDFFKEKLVMNSSHKGFIDFLNKLDGYEDVMYITSEMPYYWAICIIQNEKTTNDLINGKTKSDFFKWKRERYYKEKRIAIYIIEGVNEDNYNFIEDGVDFTFHTKKFHDFVYEIITVFFNKEVKNNIQRAYFLSLLNSIHIESSFDKVKELTPYQWALRLIYDKEEVKVLEKDRYKNFLTTFLQENSITNYLVKKNFI